MTSIVQVIFIDGTTDHVECIPFASTLLMPRVVGGRYVYEERNGKQVIAKTEFRRETSRRPPGWHGPSQTHMEIDPETGCVYEFRFREVKP